jgi:UDPglucose 6-dehydrogenase
MAIICMTGEWHQAIVLAATLADLGHEIRGVTETAEAADRLNAARPPVHEPDLPELMQRGFEAGRLSFMTSMEAALAGAEYVFIAIDTPIDDNDTPDLSTVEEMAERIGRCLGSDITLVVTAQVPVGSCERLRDAVAALSGWRVDVAHVPEFLRLGHAIRTFVEADRFIIGASEAVAARVAEIYEPTGRPILRMDVRSAEMAKHASNAFLAMSISFANEIADLCQDVGADIDMVTAGMKLDRRIGAQAFLSAGMGFAGGTLGRDLRALQGIGQAVGRPTDVIDATMRVNLSRASLVRRRLEQVFDSLTGLRVAILGLTYKPGTSTMRRSIALQVIRDLTAAGVSVAAFDPLANMKEVAAPPMFERAPDPITAAADADAAVLITEWSGVDDLDLERLCRVMRRPVFIDTGNRMAAERMSRAGFIYLGVGKGRVGVEGLNDMAPTLEATA